MRIQINQVKIILLSVSTCGLFLQADASTNATRIDSLKNVLQTAKEDTNRINTLNALSDLLWKTGDYEQSLQYTHEVIEMAKKLKGFESFSKKALANAYTTSGIVHYRKGDYDHAAESHAKALKIREEIGDKNGTAASYNNIGEVHRMKGNYDTALEFYFKSLKIAEEIGDKQAITMLYNNIGIIHFRKDDYDKALEFNFKALKIREETGDKNGMAASYNNIGTIHYKKGEHDQALEFYLKSLKIKEEAGDKKGIAGSANNIGNVYVEKGDYTRALEFYFKSLKIKEEIGDKQGIATSYNNIGNLYLKQNKIKEGKESSLKSLEIAKSIGSKEDMKEAYFNLSLCDSAAGNFKDAYEYHQLYSQIKDSIFNEESQKQITEMQTKYETEKKDKEIQLLNKDKEIQQTEIARQKLVRNAVAGGLVLVAAFAFVLFNRFRLIRRQKKIIEKEREKSEKLLLNILPKDTAEELKTTGKAKPQYYEMVTVMFTDFKGFTTIAEKMSAEELVSELDFIFKRFDEIISKYPIEKIKTIGDAYMCAGGLPVANITNPVDVVMAALEIQEFMEKLAVGNMQLTNEKPKLPIADWKLRIGIHTGPVIAGVVGDKKFAYDIWGDTVNTASRMESSGEAGKVNISESTYHLVKNNFNCTYRGKIKAKNKGEISMYFIEKNSFIK